MTLTTRPLRLPHLRLRLPALVLLLTCTPVLPASALIAPVAPGSSPDEAREALTAACGEVRTVPVEPPSHPLAEAAELHVLCSNLSTPAGEVQRVAFTFADGTLVAAQAVGGAVEALGSLGEKATAYLHFRVSEHWERFVDDAADTVYFLTREALHPNLFAWPNPYLRDPEARPAYAPSAAIPELLRFGAELEALLPALEEACPLLDLRRGLNVWLPHSPTRQDQVDCFGFEYAGFPRKVEAVFGDGVFELAWILTGAGEEARVRRALVEAFGAPESVTDKWEVFHGGRVGLRKDKPEVLLLSERLAPLYAAELAE